MKAKGIVAVLVLALDAMGRAETTPDDLIRAVDRMNPEQAYEFQRKLEAKLWKPIPEGFFSRMAVDFGASYAAFDTVDLTPIALAGGDMNVDKASGLDMGLLWRLVNDRFRFGLRFGSWAANDSNLADAGYSGVDIVGGSIALAANYQWLRSASWLLWTEVAPGVSSLTIDTVNTPTGQTTTLREFNGSFGQVDLQGGASWRFNPVLSLCVSAGYRFADSVDLDEGGHTTDVKVDASGFTARMGLGVNL